MTMGLISAGLGLAAPAVANALGIGKNNTRAKTFNETGAYNPNAFHYGGTPNGANDAANRYANIAAGAQGRTAAQANTVNANYGMANGYAGMGVSDRNNQGSAAHMMMARAQGLVPSIASQQAQLDMNRATAAQASAGASARGAAGIALAGQNAANNTATMQSAISNQAQINAANERLQAEGAAYGAYSGMRGQDDSASAEAARRAQFDAQTTNQGNQFNAGLVMQQHGLNDVYSTNMYNDENNVRTAELNAGIQGQGILNNSTMNATNQNVAISKSNADVERGYYTQAMGALGGGVDSATKSGLLGAGGGAAPPQPNVPSPPPVNSTAVNGVGVPVPSDDRMKFGMSPLGLLGFGGGGGSGPSSGPAATSWEQLDGNGGENVAASGQAMSRNATRFGSDPTSFGDGPGAGGSMMGGGLLSDDRAKQDAYALGMQAGRAESARQTVTDMDRQADTTATGREDASREWLRDMARPQMMGTMAGNPAAGPLMLGAMAFNAAADHAEGDMWRRGDRGLPEGGGSPSGAADLASGQGRALAQGNSGTAAYVPFGRNRERAVVEREPARALDRDGTAYAASRADPVTEQLAQGLAPIQFQYKPGMGPPGRQTGVRAQAAASQPITASMINRRPDGLLAIDPQMGLGTALAGVGHLAAKQKKQDEQLQGLLATSARREGY